MGSGGGLFAKAWILQLACAGGGIGALLALGVSATVVAPLALGVVLGITLLLGGKVRRRALEVSEARRARRLETAQAQRGEAVARAHDWMRNAQDRLEDFAAAGSDAEAVESAEQSIELLQGLRDSLDRSRASREQFKRGRIPVIGGNADVISKRLGSELKSYRWTPKHWVPPRFRGGVDQTTMVIEEIRVLHDAEIERSVFLLTLVARALLILLAPLLGAWTSAKTPVAATGAFADLVWLAAATISIGTVVIAPRAVDLAMTDSPTATRFRRRLLWIEVPIALAVLILQPAWTVVVFVTGWTNWWQRQTPGLAFDWRKLAIFVAAVIVLQSIGLALQVVAIGPAALEVALALVVIAVTGGSYGAMLPVTIATAIAVVVGDGARSIRVARAARLELLACSNQLFRTAAVIDATAPEMPLARNAASMARKGAENLEREAELFGRRGVLARRVLVDLFDQAVSRSALAREDSREYRDAAETAATAGEKPPAYAMDPLPDPVLMAQIRERGDANALLHFLIAALNEASVHGTDGVRLLCRKRDDKLRVTVGNMFDEKSIVVPNEGEHILRYYASKLPGGRLTEPFGPRPGSAVESALPFLWWVAEVECDIRVLSNPLE
jgi:hypothetical protein